jgi:hypothetical protein
MLQIDAQDSLRASAKSLTVRVETLEKQSVSTSQLIIEKPIVPVSRDTVAKNDDKLVRRVRNAKLALVGTICIGAAIAALIFLKKKRISN